MGKETAKKRRFQRIQQMSSDNSDSDEEQKRNNKRRRRNISIKQEKTSSDKDSSDKDSSDKDSHQRVRVKVEPRSENDDDEYNNSDSDKVPDIKKHFRRIRTMSDSSDLDSDAEKTSKTRSRQRKPMENKPSSSSSSDSESSSGSSSTKGNIEFESSDEDQGSDKSYTSSESDEVDEDESAKLCIICRNLGNARVRGRSKFNTTSPWCKCGHCKIVGTMKDYDRICCREIKDIVVFLNDEMEDASKKNLCLTSHPRFETDVVKCRALNRTGYRRTDNYGNSDTYMGSWSYIRMIWDRIGWGNRMVVPACVAARLKEEYGTKHIQSFVAVTTCKTANHCLKSQM